jgi:hypothetical protein
MAGSFVKGYLEFIPSDAYPSHPIAPGGPGGWPSHPIAPGGGPHPSHPIAPGGNWPAHPIAPGGPPPYPAHPIVIPGWPAHPISPGGGPRPEHPISPGGQWPSHPIAPGGIAPEHPIVIPIPPSDGSEGAKGVLVYVYVPQADQGIWFLIQPQDKPPTDGEGLQPQPKPGEPPASGA